VVRDTDSYPEIILRYGVSDRVELRLGWNYEAGGAGNQVTGANVAEAAFLTPGQLLREYRLAYGVKVQVTDQDGVIPRSSILIQGATPTGGSAGTSTATQLNTSYVAGWQLPNRWRLDAAIRYWSTSEAGDQFHLWAPSAVIRVPLGERLAVHAEYFAIYTAGRAENTMKQYFSPGVHFLLTPDLEVGLRVGWGLNDPSARYFTNAGVGLRY
jgi:hypothetical protein